MVHIHRIRNSLKPQVWYPFFPHWRLCRFFIAQKSPVLLDSKQLVSKVFYDILVDFQKLLHQSLKKMETFPQKKNEKNQHEIRHVNFWGRRYLKVLKTWCQFWSRWLQWPNPDQLLWLPNSCGITTNKESILGSPTSWRASNFVQYWSCQVIIGNSRLNI